MSYCLIYRGFHSSLFTNLLETSLNKESSLLIVCPPRYKYEDIKALVKTLPFKNARWIDDIEKTEEEIELKSEFEDSKSLKFIGEKIKIGLFTSGSSDSNQKIIFYTLENFKSSLSEIYKLFKYSENIFCYPQPYHIFGLSLGYIYSQNSKKNLIVPQGKYSSQAHESWLKASNSYKDLITLGTPTHFKDLISHIKFLEPEISPTYSCILGGARVNKALWYDVQEHLKIGSPSIGYGCTEASPGLFHLPPGEAPEMDGAIGKKLEGVTFDFHEDGSFSFSGKNLSKVWLDRKGLHFCEELRVLDVLTRFRNGQYACTGRLSEVINRGGEKFFSEDLEAFFNKHSISLVCLKKPCARLGEDIFFLVEGAETGEALRRMKSLFFDKFQRSLSDKNIFFVDTLPLNDSHKIDRFKCLSLIQQVK